MRQYISRTHTPIVTGEEAAKAMKKNWQQSLYRSGEEIDLFNDVRFIEQPKAVPTDVMVRGMSSMLQQSVDLKFLRKYKVHESKGMLVYKLPVDITFDLELDRLRNYFEQLAIGRPVQMAQDFRNGTHVLAGYYLLRMYLLEGVNYKTV